MRELDLSKNASIGYAGAFALAGGIRQAGAWVRHVNQRDTSVRERATTGNGDASGVLLLHEAVEAWSLRHNSNGGKGGKNALKITLPGRAWRPAGAAAGGE